MLWHNMALREWKQIIVRFSSVHSSYYFSALGPGNFEGRQVEAAILLIGEYPVLLSMRAQFLKEWQTSTTDSAAAAQALRERRYDLLIFCQSIRGSTVQILIAHARTLYPDIMVLALSYAGEQRPGIYHPSKLREAVADLLIKANKKRKNKVHYCVDKN
jgi:hypothetical protein